MNKQLIIEGNCATQHYTLSSDVRISAFRIREVHIPYEWYNLNQVPLTIRFRDAIANPFTITPIELNGNYNDATICHELNQYFPQGGGGGVNNSIYFRPNNVTGRIELQVHIVAIGDTVDVDLTDPFYSEILGFDAGQLIVHNFTAVVANQYFTLAAPHYVQLNPIMLYLHLPQMSRFAEHVSSAYPRSEPLNTKVAMIPINTTFGNLISFRDDSVSLIECNPFSCNMLQLYFTFNNEQIIYDPTIYFWVIIEYQ